MEKTKSAKKSVKKVMLINAQHPEECRAVILKDNCIDDYIDEDQQDELYDYFIESDSDDIELALKEFEGEYDEFELKLFRIKFLSDLAN